MQITGVKSTNNAFGTSHMEFRCELLEGRDVVIGISKIVSLEDGIKNQQVIREQLVLDAFSYYKNIGPKILETRQDNYFEKALMEDPGVVYPVAPSDPKPTTGYINPVTESNSAKQALEDIKKFQEQKKQEEQNTVPKPKVHKWVRQHKPAKYGSKCEICRGQINPGDQQSFKTDPEDSEKIVRAHVDCVPKN